MRIYFFLLAVGLLSPAALLTSTCHAGEVKIPLTFATDSRPGLVKTVMRVPTVHKNGTVHMKLKVAQDMPETPSQVLSAAIKANPGAEKFRMTWSSSNPRVYFNSTVLYDRNQKTLKYYYIKKAGIAPPIATYYTRATSTHVTPDLLHQLALGARGNLAPNARKSAPDDESGGFTHYLKRYGARLTLFKKWTKWHPRRTRNKTPSN